MPSSSLIHSQVLQREELCRQLIQKLHTKEADLDLVPVLDQLKAAISEELDKQKKRESNDSNASVSEGDKNDEDEGRQMIFGLSLLIFCGTNFPSAALKEKCSRPLQHSTVSVDLPRLISKVEVREGHSVIFCAKQERHVEERRREARSSASDKGRDRLSLRISEKEEKDIEENEATPKITKDEVSDEENKPKRRHSRTRSGHRGHGQSQGYAPDDKGHRSRQDSRSGAVSPPSSPIEPRSDPIDHPPKSPSARLSHRNSPVAERSHRHSSIAEHSHRTSSVTEHSHRSSSVAEHSHRRNSTVASPEHVKSKRLSSPSVSPPKRAQSDPSSVNHREFLLLLIKKIVILLSKYVFLFFLCATVPYARCSQVSDVLLLVDASMLLLPFSSFFFCFACICSNGFLKETSVALVADRQLNKRGLERRRST